MLCPFCAVPPFLHARGQVLCVLLLSLMQEVLNSKWVLNLLGSLYSLLIADLYLWISRPWVSLFFLRVFHLHPRSGKKSKQGQNCSWAHLSLGRGGVVALLFWVGLEMGWIAIPFIPKEWLNDVLVMWILVYKRVMYWCSSWFFSDFLYDWKHECVACLPNHFLQFALAS